LAAIIYEIISAYKKESKTNDMAGEIRWQKICNQHISMVQLTDINEVESKVLNY